MKHADILRAIGLMLFVCSARAEYTANYTSTVQWIKIYNSDTIYFRLSDQPTTACPDAYFVLSPSLTEKQRDRYYALLLTARTTGVEVSVGYDGSAPDCYNGRPIVHALTIGS